MAICHLVVVTWNPNQAETAIVVYPVPAMVILGLQGFFITVGDQVIQIFDHGISYIVFFFYLYNLETHGDLGIPMLRYRSLFHDHCAMAASVPGLFGPNAPAFGALERKAWKMSDFTEDFGGNVAMNTPFMES